MDLAIYIDRLSTLLSDVTSPRWYEPDQVPRVKKRQRVSLSAQLTGHPLLSI